MAASCNFLQIPSSRNFYPASVFSSSTHPRPSLISFPHSLSSHHRLSSPLPKEEEKEKSFPTIEAIVNPSLEHANLFFFRSGYNVQIVVGEDESEEALLRRFRREVSKVGVVQECKRRRSFENKQEEKKRKAREAGRRNRRRRLGPRFPSSKDGDAASKKSGPVDDGDNWEMPERDVPF